MRMRVCEKYSLEDVCTLDGPGMVQLFGSHQEGTSHRFPVASLLSWRSSPGPPSHGCRRQLCPGQALLRLQFCLPVWCWKSLNLRKPSPMKWASWFFSSQNVIMSSKWSNRCRMISTVTAHTKFPINGLYPHYHCHCLPATVCSSSYRFWNKSI